MAALVALIPPLFSFTQTMAQRSDSSFSIRAVEWARDHGARGLVTQIENFYYSTIAAPPTGGPALKALPHQTALGAASLSRAHARRAVVSHYRPRNIAPIIHPALPGEGVWHATFAPGGARPPVLVTQYRPNPQLPQLVAGVAWIDHTRTSLMLYPGLQEPAVSMPSRGPEELPLDQRYHLVAAFNSGFKLADSGGGFVYDRHTYAPMHNGMATVLRYTDGRVDIVDWTGGSTAPSDVAFARQNLPLIVNNGRPNPNLSDGPEWGATLGNAVEVWRSAIGIDRHGNLIYVAADYQTVGSLAQILIHAGAVRGMELDINAYWPSFITYRAPGAVGAANLLAGMQRSPLRYLTPDDRDFFAVYLR